MQKGNTHIYTTTHHSNSGRCVFCYARPSATLYYIHQTLGITRNYDVAIGNTTGTATHIQALRNVQSVKHHAIFTQRS